MTRKRTAGKGNVGARAAAEAHSRERAFAAMPERSDIDMVAVIRAGLVLMGLLIVALFVYYAVWAPWGTDDPTSPMDTLIGLSAIDAAEETAPTSTVTHTGGDAASLADLEREVTERLRRRRETEIEREESERLERVRLAKLNRDAAAAKLADARDAVAQLQQAVTQWERQVKSLESGSDGRWLAADAGAVRTFVYLPRHADRWLGRNHFGKSDLAADDVSAWCAEMTRQDRVGFVCDAELASLANKVNR